MMIQQNMVFKFIKNVTNLTRLPSTLWKKKGIITDVPKLRQQKRLEKNTLTVYVK